MNTYSIYWIKEEFAYRYFYKSDILLRFIISYQKDTGRQDLSKQYHYITNRFPKEPLISHIKRDPLHKINIEKKDNTLKLSRNTQCISLQIHKKHLKFYCDTLDDAEDVLFPTLRLFHPFLFVIGNNLKDYGWISPVIKK